MSPFLIYGLVDPRTGLLRYIGQTSHGLRRPRSEQRIALRDRHIGTHHYRWLRVLANDGWVRPLSCYTNAQIGTCSTVPRSFGSATSGGLGFDLVNSTAGGIGLRGYQHTMAAKNRISNALKGRTVSRDTRLRQSRSRGGRAVVNLDTGIRYETIREASRALGIHETSISQVVRGTKARKRAGGYRFAFVGEPQRELV